MHPFSPALLPWFAATTVILHPAAAAAAAPAISAATDPIVDDTVFEHRCHDAVLDLHQFFEDWFNARLPNTTESLVSFRDVLSEDFQYVGPAGFLIDKSIIFENGTWPGHGWWIKDGAKGGKTRVENFAFRRLSESTALVTFEYWQDKGESKRGRQNTAIFRLDPSMPHGVVWLHVQETWLPGTELP